MTRLALFLIGMATPASDREWVLGDTVEELQRREQAAGRSAARRWLMREAIRVMAGAWRHRLAVRSTRRPLTAPRVAIVNRAFAERYFRNSSAIGKKIWQSGRQQTPFHVVGVIANSRTDDLTRAPEPELYLSLWQASAFSKDLVVATTTDPRVMMPAIQTALRGVDPTVAIENVRTLEQVRDRSVATRTFAMQLLVGFAIVASVRRRVWRAVAVDRLPASRDRSAQRRRRAAARHSQPGVRRRVPPDRERRHGRHRSGRVLSRGLTPFLFGVEATDLPTLAAVGLLFAGVALSACWIPTRRAATIEPLEALRDE